MAKMQQYFLKSQSQEKGLRLSKASSDIVPGKTNTRVESIINSYLKTKSYPEDRCMTEAEVEEVRQAVRQKGY